MTPAPLKRCPKCGLEKPLVDYYTSVQTNDGYFWSCKACELARAASRRRAAGQEKRTPKPPQPSAKEKMACAVDALNAVHIALRLAAAGKLDAELLVATRKMVRQTLEVVSKTERTTEVKEIG